MKTRPFSARVLVASDSRANAAQICHQLAPDFLQIRASIKMDLVAEDLAAFEPNVLVLAFDSLSKAHAYASQIYGTAENRSRRTHVSILLCNTEEVRTAFELCKEGSFDDYVLYWPHAQDGLRLTMSVWNAARAVIGVRTARASPGDLISHLKHLGRVQSLVNAEISHGHEYAASCRETLRLAERAIGEAIEGLSRHMSDRSRAHTAAPTNFESLMAGGEPLKTSPGSKAWEGTTTASEPSSAKLGEQVAPQRKTLITKEASLATSAPVLMVVDDDEFTRELILGMLQNKAYGLTFASDGAAALALLRKVRPSLILMDVNLPDIDGVALTQQVKTIPHLVNIPVLMLSGDTSRDTLEKSMRAGAAGFLVKPFTQDALLSKLDKLLPLAA